MDKLQRYRTTTWDSCKSLWINVSGTKDDSGEWTRGSESDARIAELETALMEIKKRVYPVCALGFPVKFSAKQMAEINSILEIIDETDEYCCDKCFTLYGADNLGVCYQVTDDDQPCNGNILPAMQVVFPKEGNP